jgi:hypothetical protein
MARQIATIQNKTANSLSAYSSRASVPSGEMASMGLVGFHGRKAIDYRSPV